MAPDRDASETSPLLGQAQNGSANGKTDSVAVEGGSPTDSANASADLERWKSVDEARDAQFKGAPEIQEKLKYILPAISIGVCCKNTLRVS